MIVYFHRCKKAGFSINKVTQSYVRNISDKKEYYVPHLSGTIKDVLQNMWFVFKHRDKHSINHVTGDIHNCILALFGCKSILTIHDTVSIHFAKNSKLKKIIQEWLWFRLPIKYATKVVCISEETKRCILNLTKRDDIMVIHNAVDSCFQTKIKDETKIPYDILFIGANPNKNLERTVQALNGIDCKLTVIGRLSPMQIEYLEQSKIFYSVKSGLTDEEMVKEYEQCDIVSFISLFEGFGMPIIEANKVGRPVITSTIPVLKEVAGDAAVFVNPNDVDDMHKGFVRLFTDEKLRKDCVTKGLENVKRFDPEIITRQYIKLYESL